MTCLQIAIIFNLPSTMVISISEAFIGVSCVIKASQNVVYMIKSKSAWLTLPKCGNLDTCTILKCLNIKPMPNGNNTVCDNIITEFIIGRSAVDPNFKQRNF